MASGLWNPYLGPEMTSTSAPLLALSSDTDPLGVIDHPEVTVRRRYGNWMFEPITRARDDLDQCTLLALSSVTDPLVLLTTQR